MTDAIPFGYCHCGCGQKTSIIRARNVSKGRIEGQPNKFIKGHAMRLLDRPADYVVDDTTGCWVWQHYLTPDGYGRRRFEGRYGKAMLAHRWYYEQHVGPIPEGLVIDHLCRNRACVNPEHLEPVTLAENILRGEGTGAKHARRTHCKRGHSLSGNNLRIRANGSRECRACRAIWRKNERRTA